MIYEQILTKELPYLCLIPYFVGCEYLQVGRKCETKVISYIPA